MEAEAEGEGAEKEEEGPGVQEGWFSIPELPIGRELVINILSTWGDRFYVGLTGIEIYTASGEQANIKHVNSKTVLPSTCCMMGRGDLVGILERCVW